MLRGASYCGLTIGWNYAKNYVDTSIPGYTKKAFQQLKHTEIQKDEYAPASYNKPYLISKEQWAYNASTEEILAPSYINHVQSVVGTLLIMLFWWKIPLWWC